MVSDLTGILNQILSTWLIVEVRRVTQIEDTATVIATAVVVHCTGIKVFIAGGCQVELRGSWDKSSTGTLLITAVPIEILLDLEYTVPLQITTILYQVSGEHGI